LGSGIPIRKLSYNNCWQYCWDKGFSGCWSFCISS